mgnify:CR=1 FL=1
MSEVKGEIDELDLKIVDMLNEEPRRPVKNIAKKVNVTVFPDSVLTGVK